MPSLMKENKSTAPEVAVSVGAPEADHNTPVKVAVPLPFVFWSLKTKDLPAAAAGIVKVVATLVAALKNVSEAMLRVTDVLNAPKLLNPSA